MADLKLLLQDDSGLELSEYVVAAGLVVIAIVVALDNLGDKIAGVMTSLANLIGA